MKKVVLFFAVSASMALASCGGSNEQAAPVEAVDTVETVVADTTAQDSAAADSVAADSTVAAADTAAAK